MDVRHARKLTFVLAMLVGAAAAPVAASEDPLPPAKPVAPPPRSFGTTGWQDDFLARSIVRTALLDLRQRPVPSTDDYRMLSAVLTLAESIQPTDTDIVRRRIEAAANAGDSALVESATRRLVELDPTDTVAQLRLISARIASLQTVEDRLKAYAGFLGDRGAALDGSVRSRLAVDAALLQRETGNMDAFAEHLKAALKFDSTNKQAALLALEHYTQRVGDPVGIAQLLSNLLLSDPLDPNVHRRFSLALAAGGAYPQAKRFHTIANALQSVGNARGDDHFAVEEWIVIWAVSGPSSMLEQLENVLKAQRYQARVSEERAKKELRQATTKESDVVLAAPLERIRILAADAAQDQTSLEASRDAINNGCTTVLDELEKLKKAPPDPASSDGLAEAKTAAALGVMEFQLLRLWTNVDVEKVPDAVAKCREAIGPDASEFPTSKAIDAWTLLRAAKNDEALAAFEALENLDFELLQDRSIGELEPIRIGKALTLEALGRDSEAAEIYRLVARDRPLDGSGMWARSRLEKMGGSDPQRDELGRKLTAIAQSIPSLVEDVAKDPASIESVTADVPATFAAPTDRNDLVIKIRNKSRIPLGLGPDRAINSRILVQPAVEIHTFSQTLAVRPEVLELDRRFRLMPGETLQLQVRGDAGFTGWIIESGASKVVRSRFRLLQGFTPTQDGSMVAGPGCVAADSPQVIRNPIKEALLSPADLVEKIKTAQGDEMIAVLLAVRSRAEIDDSLGAPDRTAMAHALAERYPTLDLRTRLIALNVVPNAAMKVEFAEVDQAARHDSDPKAAALAILTRVTDKADEALTRAQAAADPLLKQIAALQQARLESPAPCLSRTGFRPAVESTVTAPPTAPAPPPAPTVPQK